MAKKKNSVKNNNNNVEVIENDVKVVENVTEEVKEQPINDNISQSIVATEDKKEWDDINEASMVEIMAYKNGLNSVLKYYTDLCEINHYNDENAYHDALTKLNKLRKYETHIIEVIENKIKKIKL